MCVDNPVRMRMEVQRSCVTKGYQIVLVSFDILRPSTLVQYTPSLAHLESRPRKTHRCIPLDPIGLHPFFSPPSQYAQEKEHLIICASVSVAHSP